MNKVEIAAIGVAVAIVVSLLAMFGISQSAHAQIVPAQNQQVLSPYGGFIVATSSSATSKLSASSTPFFSSFFATLGSIGTLTIPPLATPAGSFLAVNGNGVVIATTTPASGTGTVTSIATTYPVTGGPITTTGTIGLAFGTTTSNTWAGTQTFTNTIVVGALSGLVGANSGTLYSFASSSLFGYIPVPPTRQITVAGTANQITSSAGAQDLSADRTWTLSLPNHVIFPLDFLTTNSSTTNATTTGSFYITPLATAAGAFLAIDPNGRVISTTTPSSSAPSAFEIATTSDIAVPQLAYFTKTSGRTTLGSVATTSVSCSGSVSCTAFTALGAAPVTISSAALTSAVTSIGPAGQLQTGPAVTLATSTTAFNGLTSNLTITGNTNTITFAPILSGLLGIGGGGTNATSFPLFSPVVFDGTRLVGTTTSPFYVGAIVSTTSATSTFVGGVDASRFKSSATSTLLGVQIPTGGLSIATIAGCNTTSALTTDGSGNVLCGAISSSGGIADPFIHPTNVSSATSSAVLVGTTTGPVWAQFLSATTTNGAQIGLSAGAGQPGLGFFNQSGNLFIATTTGAGATTSMSTLFASGGLGTMVGQGATVPVSAGLYTLFIRDQNGVGPRLTLGGNAGGDSNWNIYRTADNDGVNDDPLTIGIGDEGATPSANLTLLPSGLTGVASSTPWGLLSVASSTWANYSLPLLSVATSSGSDGRLFDIFATSSPSNLIGATSFLVESGARAIIGGLGPLFSGLGALDQLLVNGRIYQTQGYVSCDSMYVGASITTNTGVGPCGNITPSVSAASGPSIAQGATNVSGDNISMYINMTKGGGANNGAGLLTGKAPSLVSATSTPVIEITARINAVQNATTTQHFLGFFAGPILTNLNSSPTSGCFFAASSTQPNWQAICGTSATAQTMVNTGVASSTVVTGTGQAYRFRVQMDNTHADFFIQSTQNGALRKVASISTNYPATTALFGGIYYYGVTAGTPDTLDVFGWRHWFNRVLPFN